MSDYDTAATIEDGTNESLQAGANLSHLPQHVQNELKRRAPQTKQKDDKQLAADAAFLRTIEALNAQALEQPLYTHGVSVTAVYGASTFLYAGRSHDDDLDLSLEHNAA